MERGTLWVMELDASDVPVVTPRVPAMLEEVHEEAAGALAPAMGLSDPEPVLRRLATGRRCFAAWIGKEIAAYGWVSRGCECVGELEREMRMQPDEAYIWDCATLPAYRQQRLYSALLCSMTRELQADGVRRVWIGTALANRPSLQGFANAGFQPIISLTYMRFFSLSITWISGVSGASDSAVTAARRAFAAEHEHRLGLLAVGRLPAQPLAVCAQLQT
jgi:GNAT superfamily N-acetyltransferase